MDDKYWTPCIQLANIARFKIKLKGPSNDVVKIT